MSADSSTPGAAADAIVERRARGGAPAGGKDAVEIALHDRGDGWTVFRITLPEAPPGEAAWPASPA